MIFYKRLTAVLMLITFFSALSAPVYAQSLQDKLSNLKQQADVKKEQINSAKQKETTVSEQLHQISIQVDTATAEYNKIKKDLDATQAKIDANQALLTKTEKSLEKRHKILYKRIRDIYIHGQISYIDVLVGANDFSDFLTRLSLVKRIIRYDYNLINDILKEKATIDATKAELEKDKQQISKLAQAAKEKANILEDKKHQQQALLYKVQNDRKTAEQAYDELMAASRQVEQMIMNYTSSHSDNIPAGNGTFIWPLSGPITSPFGWRTHPIYGRRIFHSGIDIGGDYGLPIRAAASGVVIYAGWISGYGNAVIISHGGGLQTLYGHNQSLNVSEGQHVSQGQVISYCGSTGNSTGPHCHFEVRKNGEPVNPLNYL